MDLMDDELRRVLSGSVDASTDSMARELDRLRVRDRGPTVTERAAASQPSFRMPSSGRRRPEQRGGGEALETLGSAIAGSVPAGLAGAAVLPFQGPEGAAKTIGRVQDYLTIDPQTEGGVRALRGIAGALSPLGAVPQAAGDATLRATGSPLLATGAELLADPLNLLGIGATAKPIARGAAAAGRGAAKAGKATAQSLGPKAAEMAEAYMRRAGMTPEITVYHGSPHIFPAEEGLPLGRFRAEKIGTGEGNQTYGHGIYAAEAKPVAERYRIGLSNPRQFLHQELESILPFELQARAPDWAVDISSGKTFNDLLATVKQPWKKASLLQKKPQIEKFISEAQSGGSLYTVDLPDPIVDKMLDWDKPLGQQSPDVQKAAQRIAANLDPDARKLVGDSLMSLKGSKLYELLASDDSVAGAGRFGAAASAIMREHGIPGIKYLDDQSRAAGQGTRNFVVFPGEEKNLTILQRNEQRLPQADTPDVPKIKESDYETVQEGPFYRVNPRSAQADRPKTRGVREEVRQADDAPGSVGNDVPKPISDETISSLIRDPSNFVRRAANEYSQRVTGQGYQMPDMPPSSLAKQSAIGRAFMAADEGSDAYKQAVFEAYGSRFPELVEAAGAQNYDQLVEAAYRQLNKETLDQFRTLPVNMSFHRAGEGNYQSSGEMLRDIYGNRHLYVFQGGEPHPMMSGVDPATGLNDTEMFRAVHDFYGHGAHGNSFGQKGEEIAYGAHSQMYSPLARIAMATETRGQNSFVNYTPVNAQLKQRINRLNEARYEASRRGQTADVAEIDKLLGEAWQGFRFGPQRSVLLPPEMIGLEYSGGMPGYMRPLIRPEPGTTASEMLTHFSHSPNLQVLDPTRYGTGIKGREMERLLGTQNPVMERSYAYTGDPSSVRPEPGLGRFRYGARSEGLYDLASDPLLFRTLAAEANRTPFTAKYNKGMVDPDQAFTDVERMAKEYGYEGLMNPQQGTAIMYGPTPVQPFQAGGAVKTKAQGGPVGGNMSYTQAADVIADKLIRQGMDPDRAFMTALRMSDARMKAGGAVLMAGGGDTERELTLQARNRNLAALDRALAPRARKTWDGPMIDRPIVNGKALVSAEELADFRRRFGEKMTLRDLLNADKGRGPSGAMPAARGAQGANVAPRGPLIRPDEAATLPPVGLSDIPGLVMRGMAEGAERVPAGRGAGAAFMGAALPRALSAGTTAAKTLRDHPSISPERRQMLKEMEDYISGLNQADRPAVDPKMRALEERLEPRMQVGGPAVKLTARAAARAEARLAEKAAKEAAERAAKQAAIDARTEDEKSVLEKFGQKKKQEAARTKKVREMEEKIDVPVSPKRTVASSYSAVPPDIYRQMEAQLGPDAVMKAVEAGHHLKPTPSGYVGAPRTVTNQQSLGAMRRAMDKDFADSVQAVRVADPERLGTWYDRAKLGIAESSTPSQLDRTLEQHGVYSAGVSPESELGFALKHLNSRVAGEPAMAYRGAPMRTLDEAVAQGIPANMGFKIGEYMNKNDPRIPNAGLFGVNDFRRAQGMGYTDPAGEPWRAGVTDTMHPFMDAETALQVGRSNRDKIGGRSDWAGPHIQELPWVYGKGQDLYSRGETGRFAGDELAGIKQALVEANNTARDYMYKHAGSSTHEAIPGASTGHVPQMITAPLADRLKYTETGRWDRPMPEMPLPDAPGVGAGLRDVIYSALGFRQLPSVRASGAFFPEGATVPEHQPVTIARPLLDFPTGGGAEISTPTRQTLDFAERFRALMDAQEAFGYNLPNTMGAIPGKNAVVLDTRSRNPNKLKEPHTGPRPDEQQMASLTKLLEDTGYGIAPTSRGATIFPFSPTSSTSDIKKLLKEKGAEIQSIFPSEFDLSKNTMGYGPGVGIYTPEGFKASEPFSGQATTALLKEASLLPENVARNLSESEAVRTAIKEKSARDAPLAGARSDIQETRRFFGGEDWAKAVDMIRKGMTPAAALAALGYSSLSMAEEASR